MKTKLLSKYTGISELLAHHILKELVRTTPLTPTKTQRLNKIKSQKH